MATAIDFATTGYLKGTPLTAAAISVAAGVEEVVSFTNHPKITLTLILDTDGSDVTYGFATGETGGKINPGVHCPVEAAGGRSFYINSADGANVWIRIL